MCPELFVFDAVSFLQTTGLYSSSFGNKKDFLLSKNKQIFDSWNLSENLRSDFVDVLCQQSAGLANVALKSATSWPLEVGYAGNEKEGAKHAKKQMELYNAIKSNYRKKNSLVLLVNNVLKNLTV